MGAAAKRLEPQAGNRFSLMAFAGDEVTRALIERAAAERGIGDAQVLAGGISEAIKVLAKLPTPRLVVVDTSEALEPAAAVRALAEVCDPGTRVVALGGINDINLFRELRGLGIEDYLLKPVTPLAISAVLMAPSLHDAEGASGALGRAVAVVGARGGVGATTVAVNCAALMAAEKRRVALLDLDPSFGTVSLSLDLEPGHGLSGVMASPERMDGLFVERAMTRRGEHLFVLSGEESVDLAGASDPEATGMLIDRLKRGFTMVVADVPRASPGLAGALGAIDELVLVADLGLASLRDVGRLIHHANGIAPKLPVRLVVNRAGAGGKGEMRRADFEKELGRRIDFLLPFDPKGCGVAVLAGRPLAEVARRSRITAGLRTLSRALTPSDPSLPAKGWRRWFGGRR